MAMAPVMASNSVSAKETLAGCGPVFLRSGSSRAIAESRRSTTVVSAAARCARFLERSITEPILAIVEPASDKNATRANYNRVVTESEPREAVAQLLAAAACGERLAARRARDNIKFAPDAATKKEQEHVAEREERNSELVEARLAEVGSPDMSGRFLPFFETFYARTEPADWIEAQTFHYVGDALVSEFADVMVTKLDPISAEVFRKSLGERQDEETFALDELKRAIDADPSVRERVAEYARRISGEALTQTARALDAAAALRELLGGGEGEKFLVLDLLERHRVRLDRLGIDFLESDEPDD